MKIKKMLEEYAAGGLFEAFKGLPSDVAERAWEIRVRVGLPLILRGAYGEHMDAYLPTSRDVSAMLERLAHHSLYAFESEIKNGFITINGGHRVGICGRVTLEDGRIKTIRHISGLTIRIARQVIGAGQAMFDIIGKSSQSALIISPPGAGKTTVLRDTIRLLSLSGKQVSVVDERSEIGGSYQGNRQNDLGPRTDVLDGAPKAEGTLLMLRAMSPEYICVDEIGADDDVKALMTVACCGAKILATLHGESVQNLMQKPHLAPLIESKIFTRYIFLTNSPKPGTIEAVYDADLKAVDLT